jgi:hypothetical protein
MSDAHKAMRNNMPGKPADEVPLRELHLLFLPIFPVVFIGESHLVAIDIFNAVVANGNAVRVPSDVVDDLSGFFEGLLGIMFISEYLTPLFRWWFDPPVDNYAKE